MLKKNDEEIQYTSGLGAFIHTAVMCITYPFRKPLGILIVLALVVVLAYSVPLYSGMKPAEVHQMYLNKIKDFKNTGFSGLTKDISNLVHNIPMLKKGQDKGTDQLVDYVSENKKVARQSFSTVKGEVKTLDILAEEAENVVAVPMKTEEIYQEENNTKNQKEVVVKKSDKEIVIVKKVSQDEENVLTYLDQPKEISGRVKVINANEMEVNGTYLFLYGVYSNPRYARGVKAAVFLKDSLKNEIVTCKILAYTKDNVATAECFAAGISINNILVERGFSDRVNLQ